MKTYYDYKKITKGESATASESFLKDLCNKSFLSLWSYPAIYRNQISRPNSNEGKEICDLLIVFGNNVIIFSDKKCEYPDSGNSILDWSRWFRNTILDSSKQIYGAERWLFNHKDRIYLDRQCTKPFPIDLPSKTDAVIHRIIVAHGSKERCKKEVGGSGSLILIPDIEGDAHYDINKNIAPFSIGQIDIKKGFIHIFDDVTLDILIQTLDTIDDFSRYLTKKEKFILSKKLSFAGGEEDLLAHYLKYIDDQNEHYFQIPNESDSLCIAQNVWTEFNNSKDRIAQIEANEISYTWDNLIETFSKHIIENTQYKKTFPRIESSEKIMRLMASENRTRRRLLASSLLEMIFKTKPNYKAARVMFPSKPGDPYYVFLLLPNIHAKSEQEYREVRGGFLSAYLLVLRHDFPDAQDIIGIATESGMDQFRSEDAMYFDGRIWTDEDEKEAISLKNDLKILTNTKRSESIIYEYPNS